MNNHITICEDRSAPKRYVRAGQVYVYTHADEVKSYWLCVREGTEQYRFVNLRSGQYFSGGARRNAPANLDLVPNGTCLKLVTG